MFKRTALFIAISFISILCAYGQGNIAGLALNNKQPILNGRAYFNFPSSAINMARSSDIMAAGPNPDEETRIIYDTGNMRLVFFAQELYLLGDKNLFNEVNNDSSYKANFSNKVFFKSDSLLSILSTPLKYDSSQSAILINSLLVQTYDGTLFRIDAYINSPAYTAKEQFQTLTEKVFQTLANGPRINKRNERDEKHFIIDSTKIFSFHLPANYCVTIDKAYDFEVFKIHKYRYFTDNQWANLLVYFGEHPSYVYRNYGLDERGALRDSGIFMGRYIKWLYFTVDMQGIFLREQIIPQDEMVIGQQIHIAMMANKQEALNELMIIAESMKLDNK